VIPSRTSVQCLHRWQKVLRPGLKKGGWTPAEDEVIKGEVAKKGVGSWTAIAESLPGRLGKQCRERWYNHLNPVLSFLPFTAEEDEIILREVAERGTKWCEICKLLTGRSDNMIKNRWNCSLKHGKGCGGSVARSSKKKTKAALKSKTAKSVAKCRKRKYPGLDQQATVLTPVTGPTSSAAIPAPTTIKAPTTIPYKTTIPAPEQSTLSGVHAYSSPLPVSAPYLLPLSQQQQTNLPASSLSMMNPFLLPTSYSLSTIAPNLVTPPSVTFGVVPTFCAPSGRPPSTSGSSSGSEDSMAGCFGGNEMTLSEASGLIMQWRQS